MPETIAGQEPPIGSPEWPCRCPFPPLQTSISYCNLYGDSDSRGGKVITFSCTIQEGVISEEMREILNLRLVQIAAEVLGEAPDDISVSYEVIPRGFGFRGGELSTSSSVRSVIPVGFSQEKRVQFMQGVQDMWMEVTGQTTAELVVGAADFGHDPHRASSNP